MTDTPATPADWIPSSDQIPRHVAIIMDGNGRWAREQGLPRLVGHRAGTDNVRTVLQASVEFGIKYLTIYAFSTENWHRPVDEVEGLFGIMAEVIRNETEDLHQNGVCIRHVGRSDNLPPDLVAAIADSIALTRDNRRLVLNVAFNYGGRAELVDAVRKIIDDHVPAQDVNEDTISRYLYTAGQPDPDLIIRTAGEMRLSNFLIWQSAYAEYYTTPTYWPDFDREQLRLALVSYARRQRRFGGVLTGSC
ncbi:MAG TPA: polyprenyl diphosphate synthase [Chloroflexota bacterium]|nr:polyprenyl diphosphate synthase [Chloroflexota bacterium]